MSLHHGVMPFPPSCKVVIEGFLECGSVCWKRPTKTLGPHACVLSEGKFAPNSHFVEYLCLWGFLLFPSVDFRAWIVTRTEMRHVRLRLRRQSSCAVVLAWLLRIMPGRTLGFFFQGHQGAALRQGPHSDEDAHQFLFSFGISSIASDRIVETILLFILSAGNSNPPSTARPIVVICRSWIV
ncbi:hypothetical protein BDV95DRAFT_336579 [Massariosphaeria phaeospora]|uniref:Uncharacterized protein n=1 Tax=Massariosphaeria phaeospora TaxID=100035 RepID=A0A7C8IAC0_9PLEO|nr:hypothetical protein BDV95DRAFT_336579 [Massariosphaeria phaeospora]